MDEGNFQVNISLGNATMSTREDVARLLRNVAATLDNTDVTEVYLRDSDGNTVGLARFGRN